LIQNAAPARCCTPWCSHGDLCPTVRRQPSLVFLLSWHVEPLLDGGPCTASTLARCAVIGCICCGLVASISCLSLSFSRRSAVDFGANPWCSTNPPLALANSVAPSAVRVAKCFIPMPTSVKCPARAATTNTRYCHVSRMPSNWPTLSTEPAMLALSPRESRCASQSWLWFVCYQHGLIAIIICICVKYCVCAHECTYVRSTGHCGYGAIISQQHCPSGSTPPPPSHTLFLFRCVFSPSLPFFSPFFFSPSFFSSVSSFLLLADSVC
jgi:hypothetical protein